MIYVLLFLGFLLVELIYFKIAERYNILDKPNERSSHKILTIRGGGVIFPISLVVALALGQVTWILAAVVGIIALVSFIDDMYSLSQGPRAAIQVLGSLLLFYDLDLFEVHWIFIVISLILLIGWINAFNFMDGINGISVLYTLVTLYSFSLIPVNHVHTDLYITLALASAVFALFNLRIKAKAFLGDVGSISLAIILGYFMIYTILNTGGNFYYLLFFSVYGVDAVITILVRIINKENIFEPHRSHLYQFLANEIKVNHLVVSACYAAVQLAINLVFIHFVGFENLSWFEFLVSLIIIAGIYFAIRLRVIKQMSVL
ncbi:UDP-GlcNAc:UDP-phosphate GlcNAc-1-phosphate transferase [Anditalea andensis]|uniref:UDP-GlcNAc:UDP-phosphate GlcNAc-1-phosphate transferase n=2 Tax=Anditalea andensis TaxID=1048983 RepID=A0A074KRQ1_9BACT|nr:UDP-GlcNAc:UDP-phosphate GlcNAc-1-phosphate transferase [Anditalea andensis]